MSRFVITDAAQNDLEAIWLYVSVESEAAADQLIDDLIKRFPKLATFPEMGRERTELAANIRGFPVGRYVVFYRSIDDGIEIVRVLHGARDIEQLF
ncbi:MAG: type II toxin-antitoxin system RelE/ParE family toxin [Pleurocapsa sp. MO_226.B13]|nr:type II toxin-antitoxin system RelE/ParE family toxin [Pleurocapsa sp. MO_226.B13]